MPLSCFYLGEPENKVSLERLSNLGVKIWQFDAVADTIVFFPIKSCLFMEQDNYANDPTFEALCKEQGAEPTLSS